MGLLLKVEGKQINIDVTEFGMVRGYEFNYSVADSKYAKGYKDHRELIIRGSVSRTLSQDPDIMEQIRKWANIEYKDRESYYHHVKMTCIHKEEVVREITFPDAFVKDYTEEIDTHTGDGIYTLTLMQKLDKRINIVIDPFNVVHPSLSQVTKEARERREEKRREQAAAAALLLPPEDEQQEWNSPYWVARNRLVHARIRIGDAGASVHQVPNGPFVTNLRPGDMLDVRGVRIVNGVTWYNVGGWIRSGSNIAEIGNTEERGGRMIVLPESQADIVRVAGYWDPARPSGEQGTLTILNRQHFENAGTRHGFDALAGTNQADTGPIGLVEGSVVILAGRVAMLAGTALVEIIEWGPLGLVASGTRLSNTVIVESPVINGRTIQIRRFECRPDQFQIKLLRSTNNQTLDYPGTNASFFINAHTRTTGRNMTAFHFMNGRSLHIGGDNNFATGENQTGSRMSALYFSPKHFAGVRFMERALNISSLEIPRGDIVWAIGGFSLLLDEQHTSNRSIGDRYWGRSGATAMYPGMPTAYIAGWNQENEDGNTRGHARTFMAYCPSRNLITFGIMTIEILLRDGRYTISNAQGIDGNNITYHDMHTALKNLGFSVGFNLDGGGSSSFRDGDITIGGDSRDVVCQLTASNLQ